MGNKKDIITKVEKVCKKYPDDQDIWTLLTSISAIADQERRFDEQEQRCRELERRIDRLEIRANKTDRLVDAIDTIAEEIIQRHVKKITTRSKMDEEVKE